MTDVFTPEKRSAVMRRVKGRDTAPELKVIGVRSRGAEAVLHGASFAFALAYALELAAQTGRVVSRHGPVAARASRGH